MLRILEPMPAWVREQRRHREREGLERRGELKKDREVGIRILKRGDAGKRGRTDERSWWIELHPCVSQCVWDPMQRAGSRLFEFFKAPFTVHDSYQSGDSGSDLQQKPGVRSCYSLK